MDIRKPHTPTIVLATTVGVDALVEALARDLDHETILDFMKELDEAVADYDFTVSLRDHLSVVIALEDAAG